MGFYFFLQFYLVKHLKRLLAFKKEYNPSVAFIAFTIQIKSNQTDLSLHI